MTKKECNVVTLDNGIEYTEVYRLSADGNIYSFLSNLDDVDDFCIKKVIKKNDRELVIGLDNEIEFNKALALFTKEHIS